MAISLQKPNMLGANRSFGSQRTTSASTTAAQNLSSGVRPNAFSFRNISKKSWVSGQNTIKGYNQYNYQRTRAALNPRTYTAPTVDRSSVPSYANVNYQPSSSYTNGMKWGMGIAIGLGVLNTVGGMFGGNNKVSASQQLGATISSLGGNSGVSTAGTVSSAAAQAAISNMSGATDSASLRTAIGSANTQLEAMNNQLPSLEQAANQSEGELSGLKEQYSDQQTKAKEAKNDAATAKNTADAVKGDRDNKQHQVELADSAYGKASAKYTQAHDNRVDAELQFNNAKAHWSSLPEEIPDGNGGMKPNPAKEQAKTVMEQAETKLNEAKKEEEQAKTEKEQAYENLGESKAAVDKAEKDLEKAQNTLDSKKALANDAEKTVKDLDKQVKDTEAKIQSAESAISKAKAMKQDIESLRNAITNQQERLTKLEQQEINTYTTNKTKAQEGINKNNERMSQIDGDVDTAKERRLSSQMQRTNAEVKGHQAKMNSVEGNIDQTFVTNELSKQGGGINIGGVMYRTAVNPTTGNTVFARDGVMITEKEYNKETAQA